VIVDEAKQMRAPFATRHLGIGQPRAEHLIGLPQRIGVLAFEAPIGFGGLMEQPAGLAVLA
jgi:hypothetical protein